MVVQYKDETRYICNHLRQQYGVPVCQYIPGKAIDAYVVQAFFGTLSLVELDAYQKPVKATRETSDAMERAHCQQIKSKLGLQISGASSFGRNIILWLQKPCSILSLKKYICQKWMLPKYLNFCLCFFITHVRYICYYNIELN